MRKSCSEHDTSELIRQLKLLRACGGRWLAPSWWLKRRETPPPTRRAWRLPQHVKPRRRRRR